MERIAPCDAHVLVRGESGVGKEVVARMLHEGGPRRSFPFVPVNCSAVPENLAESVFFGHERGSFTGASRAQAGVFERAAGGTLLLDEITEMPLELQAKLLRVLEDGEVQRLGSEIRIRPNTRVLAATNRDPREAVAQGHLREDLYYRLSVFEVELPPLRQRAEDVPLLAEMFLDELIVRYGVLKRWDPSALVHLSQKYWPGNVRELRNFVERTYVMGGAVLQVEANAHISAPHLDSDGDRLSLELPTSIAEAERQLILRTLAREQGNKAVAAKTLGISLKTLYSRLKVYAAARGATG